MPSGAGTGTTVIACVDVVRTKATAAKAINLVMYSSRLEIFLGEIVSLRVQQALTQSNMSLTGLHKNTMRPAVFSVRSATMIGDPFLNYFALGLLIFVVIVIFYGIIAIHDIPAKIAEKRHHPHADAIHAAGWVSLFTLHVLWPFLWIWAMAYRPDRGWGFSQTKIETGQQPELQRQLESLRSRVEQLSSYVEQLEN